MNTVTLPLSMSLDAVIPVARVVTKTPKHPRYMLILLSVYGLLFATSAGSATKFLADGGFSDATALIGALSGLFAALVAGIIAIINARTKAKIEEHKAISEINSRQIQELRVEMRENTSATQLAKEAVTNAVDQTKVRVEELTKAVESNNPPTP